MDTKQLAAGDPIEARCTKCRKITNHTIVAMNASKPAKVECNTCQGQHLYRKPRATPQTTARAKATASKLTLQKKWNELQSETEGQEAKKYSMDDSYKVGALIKHTQFGIGHVQSVAGARKMEVLFTDGLKTMRCK
ncbi:MAG: hypothetical protein C0623_09165 [Desulfuromonas sp.]|nr:MAG: hypothetical protein C0623_09165 [Desulfuromonas sp.]